ncbi:hypothetical protein ACLKA6_015274 [Drosophila palustris]
MSKLLSKKRWWKIRLPHTQNDASRNYREVIVHSECASVLATTDTSSSASSGSPSHSLSCDSASKSSQPDAGKLFPRNMPSIRRSRRRSASGDRKQTEPSPAAAVTVPAKQPQHSGHQSRQSTVTKLTPRKLKATCSKNRTQPNSPRSAVVKSAVKAKTKPKQLTLAPYDIALELPAETSLEQPAPSLAMALHSQQSSLLSSDLSTSSGKLHSAHEEQFHSSGISCNGETDDDVEVAMLTGSLSPAQLQRMQQQQHQHQQQQQQQQLMPLNELRNLNVCRNRSAVWLHNTDTEQLLGRSRECESRGGYYVNGAIADDIQLSDIEEQLAKFDGHSKVPLTQQRQQVEREQQHCKAAKT